MSAVLQSPPYSLRRMHGDDLDAVMAIETAIYDFPWNRQIFADCLRVGYLCYVCEVADEIAGYCIMSTGASEAHVLNLCIAQRYRRRGLGEHLLSGLLSLAKRRAVGTVFLEVRPSNNAALALYDKMGFNQIGIRNDYYPAKLGREDAIILAKSLDF